MNPQRVSIIMSTFNRSNILAYSIGTVLRQSYTHWELIVVGDACTDDTEAVVRGFSDPRITYVNLPQNHGEQSGPNNVGMTMAAGDYLAFLNHDDLWWPDHLETAVTLLGEGKADLVYSWSMGIQANGNTALFGLGAGGNYHPRVAIPASTWVFRRSLYESVGPWKSAWSIINIPSQDWIFRAWKRGARMLSTKHVSCLILQSGDRQASYSDRQYREHSSAFERLREPAFRAQLMEQALYALSQTGLKRGVVADAKRLAGSILFGIVIGLRISPVALTYFLKYKRKGGFLDALRKVRGLPRKERV